jgi:hypothetical protein
MPSGSFLRPAPIANSPPTYGRISIYDAPIALTRRVDGIEVDDLQAAILALVLPGLLSPQTAYPAATARLLGFKAQLKSSQNIS